MPYILNDSMLKKGDIILTRNDTRTSELVRTIAGSQYSHAILYLGNHSFMEADTTGVEFFSSQRYAFKDSQNITVKRLKEQEKVSISNLVEHARKYSYRDYNMDGVKNMYRAKMQGIKVSNFNNINDIEEWDKPLFCSQLIGVVFKKSGINLSENGDLESFSPLDIESSKLLDDVVDFLIEIPEEILYQYTLHGEDELPENVLSKQTEISQEILKNIRTEYKANNLPIPADLQDAIDKLQFLSPNDLVIADQIISTQLKTSGFLDLWKEHRRLHPYLYNPFELMQQWNLDNINEMNEAVEYLNDLCNSLSETIEFQKRNLTVTTANFNKTKLKTFNLLTDMYSNYIEDLEKAKENVQIALIPLQKITEIINGNYTR